MAACRPGLSRMVRPGTGGRAACHQGLVVSAREGRWVTGCVDGQRVGRECRGQPLPAYSGLPVGESRPFLGSGGTRQNEHVPGVFRRQVTASPSNVLPTLPSLTGVSYSVFTSSLGCHVPGHPHVPCHVPTYVFPGPSAALCDTHHT